MPWQHQGNKHTQTKTVKVMLYSPSTKSKNQTGKDVREEEEDVVRWGRDIPEDKITPLKAEGKGSVCWVQTVNSWHSEDFFINKTKWNRIIEKANLHDKIMLFNILRGWEFIILVKIRWGDFQQWNNKMSSILLINMSSGRERKKKSDK